MCLIQIKHAQIKFPLFSFWTVHYYCTLPSKRQRVILSFHINSATQLFWAQMALASLVPFQGPKKSRFSGPTPSNAPCNDVAPLKTIMYRAIKTTGTLIFITVLILRGTS
jgi:hypothetical protein